MPPSQTTSAASVTYRTRASGHYNCRIAAWQAAERLDATLDWLTDRILDALARGERVGAGRAAVSAAPLLGRPAARICARRSAPRWRGSSSARRSRLRRTTATAWLARLRRSRGHLRRRAPAPARPPSSLAGLRDAMAEPHRARRRGHALGRSVSAAARRCRRRASWRPRPSTSSSASWAAPIGRARAWRRERPGRRSSAAVSPISALGVGAADRVRAHRPPSVRDARRRADAVASLRTRARRTGWPATCRSRQLRAGARALPPGDAASRRRLPPDGGAAPSTPTTPRMPRRMLAALAPSVRERGVDAAPFGLALAEWLESADEIADLQIQHRSAIRSAI